MRVSEVTEKMKKKRLRRIFGCILTFLTVFVLLQAGSVLVLRRALSAGKTELGRDVNVAGLEKQKAGSIDVLVLGDSESMTSFSPLQAWKEHGITSYVGGQYGQRVPETYGMLTRGLRKQKPKLVVLETHVLFNYSNFAHELRSAENEFLCDLFPIFRFHSFWKDAFNPKDESDHNDYKGFVIKEGRQSYLQGAYMRKTKKREEIPWLYRLYLQGIISRCKKNDIPVLLYSAPSPKNYTYSRHNTIQNFADENNLPYLDLNLKSQELKIDWQDDTMDRGDHLNLKGAKKVTAYMGNFISQLGIVPDHRGDPHYADWDWDERIYEEHTN